MKAFLISLVLAAAASGAAFDVASVKANASGLNDGSIEQSVSRITVRNETLRGIVFFAYGLAWGRDYALSGPAWLDGEKFDIVATYPAGTASGRIQEMMQALLGERFGLRTHRENRKLESYVLLAEKHGARLYPNTDGAEGAFIFGEDHLTCRAITVAGLASRLSGPVFKLGRPVVDMTGIKGAYDFTLNWSSEAALADGHAGPSIFTALQEQLGLRLEARKTAFSIVVIDHMNRTPTGN
jgi:uncharacterized protein (TIGR03435 family)